MKYELSDKEVQFIIERMVHSGNIHKFFCEHDSPDYPLKETNELIDEANRIAVEMKTQKYIYEKRNQI